MESKSFDPEQGLVIDENREIIDESDVYIDVHKAIRRLTPAPKARIHRQQSLVEEHATRSGDDSTVVADSSSVHGAQRKSIDWTGATGQESSALSSSPKTTTFMMRRSSAGADGQKVHTTIPVRANLDELRQHLKHLGPSNPATNPKNTRSTTVKVKPGHGLPQRSASVTEGITESVFGDDNESTSLLRPQITGKDGIQALRQSYGSVSPAQVVAVHLSPNTPRQGEQVPTLTLESVEQVNKSTQTRSDSGEQTPGQRSISSEDSNNRNLRADTGLSLGGKRATVRSGSITENVIESRGVRKVVLETTSSNDEDEFAVLTSASPEQPRRSGTGFIARDGPVEEDDEDDEGVLSPVTGDEDHAGPSEAGKDDSLKRGGGGGKMKSRRKKRKGGKS